MSSINTNAINTNYPVPGVNNNSQGFRDNFAAISTNLNTASSELSDLQAKVVVKQALANTVINNDMANTLISNASIRSFRATTYNLGGALSGQVKVNASIGDVQYGTVAANSNVTLQFGNWAPSGTQSNVQLSLSFNDNNSYVIFPTGVVVNENSGGSTLENNLTVTGEYAISAAAGVTQLDFRVSTLDCGNTLILEPYNRPRQSTQLQTRPVSPVGLPGDVSGTVSAGPSYSSLHIASSSGSDYLTTTGSTAQLYTDMPIVFIGTSMDPNITIGTTYYVRNVVSPTTFSISSTPGGANIDLASNVAPTSPMSASPVSSIYVCTDSYDAVAYQTSVSATDSSGNITMNDNSSFALNAPVIFTGGVVGGLVANQVYYVQTIGTGGNIKVSTTRTLGTAGSVVSLTTATPTSSLYATVYVGSDIWKKIDLTPW